MKRYPFAIYISPFFSSSLFSQLPEICQPIPQLPIVYQVPKDL
jgi:hypothetical protein